LEEKHDLAARSGRTAGAKGERARSLPAAGAERTLAEDESDRREGGHSTAGKTSGTWNAETETSQAQSWTPGAFREHSEGFTSAASLHEDEEDSIMMFGLSTTQDLGKGNDNTPDSVGDGVLLDAQIVYEYQKRLRQFHGTTIKQQTFPTFGTPILL
jgi:hypothetical protein